MPKRQRSTSNFRKQKDGRGQGIGTDYKSWVTIQDVPSRGRSHRLKGIKVSRQYEFFSDLEQNYFYLLEYPDAVVDIRKQYPLLPIEETIVIADELGIRHPTDPKRVLEKFEIERFYWERQGVDWGIVTELEVPKTMAHIIAFVHSYSDLTFIEGFEECSET